MLDFAIMLEELKKLKQAKAESEMRPQLQIPLQEMDYTEIPASEEKEERVCVIQVI
jgi:nitrate reductase NapAB chaperone NapD